MFHVSVILSVHRKSMLLIDVSRGANAMAQGLPNRLGFSDSKILQTSSYPPVSSCQNVVAAAWSCDISGALCSPKLHSDVPSSVTVEDSGLQLQTIQRYWFP